MRKIIQAVGGTSHARISTKQCEQWTLILGRTPILFRAASDVAESRDELSLSERRVIFKLRGLWHIMAESFAYLTSKSCSMDKAADVLWY
jgi:hypothetical protein